MRRLAALHARFQPPAKRPAVNCSSYLLNQRESWVMKAGKDGFIGGETE